jgi:hypothetical protein
MGKQIGIGDKETWAKQAKETLGMEVGNRIQPEVVLHSDRGKDCSSTFNYICVTDCDTDDENRSSLV